MMTIILINESGEAHIRRYPVNDAQAARDCVVRDWIAGRIQWEWVEYHGPNCTVDNPAFTPEFLRENGYENEPPPVVQEGVTIYSWFCATGPNGSDEHFVTGYFVLSQDTNPDLNSRSGHVPDEK